MNKINRVLQFGMVLEIMLPVEHARLAVLLLTSPARTDTAEGSSFGYVSGGSNPNLRGLALSQTSAKFLFRVTPGETESTNKILDEIKLAILTEAQMRGVKL